MLEFFVRHLIPCAKRLINDAGDQYTLVIVYIYLRSEPTLQNNIYKAFKGLHFWEEQCRTIVILGCIIFIILMLTYFSNFHWWLILWNYFFTHNQRSNWGVHVERISEHSILKWIPNDRILIGNSCDCSTIALQLNAFPLNSTYMFLSLHFERKERRQSVIP